MNYRVRRQIDDQLAHYGETVITRGHVLKDPPWPHLNALISAGFLAPVDAPATLTPADVVEEIVADLEPYTEILTPEEPVNLDGGSDEAVAVEFNCRHEGCDSTPWETRRARTCHEVAVHGSPGEGE